MKYIKQISILISTIAILLLGYSFLIFFSPPWGNDTVLYSLFFLISIVGSVFLALFVKSFTKGQTSKNYIFFLPVFICVSFVLGNLGNHFYSPIIYRISFCVGLIFLAIGLRQRSVLILLGSIMSVVGLLGFSVFEKKYMCDYYLGCEFIRTGEYVCEGITKYTKDLSEECNFESK